MRKETIARDSDVFTAVNIHCSLLESAISRNITSVLEKLSGALTIEGGSKFLGNVRISNNST
jgi:hypothetical protein